MLLAAHRPRLYGLDRSPAMLLELELRNDV